MSCGVDFISDISSPLSLNVFIFSLEIQIANVKQMFLVYIDGRKLENHTSCCLQYHRVLMF